MSIFESTTPEVTAPIEGQVEQGAEEQESTSEVSEQVEETPVKTQEEQPETNEQKPSFDYTKAYNELRRDYTRKAQELAQLRKQTPQNPAPQQRQGMDTDSFWAAMQNDPIGTIAHITEQNARAIAQQYVGPIYEQQAMVTLGQNLEAVAKDFPELADPQAMQDLFAKVSEIANEVGNPNIAQYPTKRILKMAAAEMYGDSKAKVYQQAKEKGREEALNNIRAKQGLSVNAGAKPQTTQKTIEDEIADSIVSAGRRGGVFG